MKEREGAELNELGLADDKIGSQITWSPSGDTEMEVALSAVRDTRVVDCERTRDMEVPRFRDGEREVRRLWDEAVAEAMGWDPEELGRHRAAVSPTSRVLWPLRGYPATGVASCARRAIARS